RDLEPAAAGRDRNVLFAADRKFDGVSLHGRAEPRLPQCLAGSYVERAEYPIDVADEADTARRRQHTGKERAALFATPDLLHRFHVVRGKLAKIAVAAGHLEEAPIRSGP